MGDEHIRRCFGHVRERYIYPIEDGDNRLVVRVGVHLELWLKNPIAKSGRKKNHILVVLDCSKSGTDRDQMKGNGKETALHLFEG